MKKLDKETIDKLKISYQDRYLFNVKDYGIVEKKGKFDYISWSYCEMLGNVIFGGFMWTSEVVDNGKYVKVKMDIVDENHTCKSRELLHPNLDFKNQPESNPNSFNINTTQMRGMSKLFSMMTGIGLSLYTGEDLPKEEVKLATPKQVEFLNSLIEQKGKSYEIVRGQLKVEDFKELSAETISQVIETFKAMEDKKDQFTEEEQH